MTHCSAEPDFERSNKVFVSRYAIIVYGSLFFAMTNVAYSQDGEGDQGPPNVVPMFVDGVPVDINAAEVLASADELQTMRLDGVTHYKVTRHAVGIPGLATITEFYRVEEIEHPAFNYYGLVPVQISQQEIATLELMAQTGATSREELSNAFAQASAASVTLGVALDSEVANAGFSGFGGAAGGLEGDTEEFGGFNPCRSYEAVQEVSGAERAALEINPYVMMLGPACYYQVLSTLLDEEPQDTEAEASAQAMANQVAANALNLVGVEQVHGRPSYHLRVEDLGLTQPVENGETTISAISTWIDVNDRVRRKQRMEGTSRSEGQVQDFVLETEYDDFRSVPGSEMYEPYRQVMRMGGTMTPEQEAEIQRAQAELEKFEQELAQMPASQRTMMERMVGPQMEQMRSLAAGGMVEFEFITERIEVNPENFGLTPQVLVPREENDTDLLRVIQTDLATLGYEPGNTDGILDTMTQVAISQYQAEAGLQVTGEPSAELASALANAVGRQ